MALDLLAPQGSQDALRQNYIHQLKQTIGAYHPANIFIGEALQNALDAIRMVKSGPKSLKVEIDFTERRVTVRDSGRGFPNKPALLFLGGGDKLELRLAGMVGVGLKVVLFSSRDFCIRARDAQGKLRVDIRDAYRFSETDPPELVLPGGGDLLPEDPEDYFPAGTGTELSYTFPPKPEDRDGVPEQYLRDVLERCLRDIRPPNYEKSLDNAVEKGFPNRLSALIASDLRRFTYVGMTTAIPELADLEIDVAVKASESSLGPAAPYADGVYDFTFQVKPTYLTVEDTLNWAKPKKPVVRRDALGDGGANLTKQDMAFNVLRFTTPDEYKALLVNARGTFTADLDRYERLLFPKLESVVLTIGRIPHFNEFLPGGSQRVISSRGVVTGHQIAIESGRNQQYVRCFDIVLNVDGDLNYGKTHLTDTHLVANVKRFVNDAFAATISNAAQNLVGKIKTGDTTKAQFWSRDDLGVEPLSQKKVPNDENDVIALFFELTGMGYFQEFVWYGLSSMDPYDGRALLLIGDDSEKERLRNSPSDSDLKKIEFKMRGVSIARDFDREEKRVDEVDLVICYEIGGAPPVNSFQVVDFEESTLYQEGKPIPTGVKHVLYDTQSSYEVPMLALQDFIIETFPPDQPPDIPAEVIDSD